MFREMTVRAWLRRVQRGKAGCVRQFFQFVLIWLIWFSTASAGSITPASLGLLTTHYEMDMGQLVVTETFGTAPVGPFWVWDNVDGRGGPAGNIVDAALAFRVAEIAAGFPVLLRVAVDVAFGYDSEATLAISGYLSSGVVGVNDFHAPPTPPIRFSGWFTVPEGNYRDAPRIFEFDVTSFVASTQAAGFDYAGLKFSMDVSRTAYASIRRVELLSDGFSAVPEPPSWMLLAPTVVPLGLACRLHRRRRKSQVPLPV